LGCPNLVHMPNPEYQKLNLCMGFRKHKVRNLGGNSRPCLMPMVSFRRVFDLRQKGHVVNENMTTGDASSSSSILYNGNDEGSQLIMEWNGSTNECR
jgi:hypothetical protein